MQSHTPLKPAMAEYADKVVLCIGGPKDAARKVGESYGLRKAVLPHDILHWNRSIWDRYKFGPADEALVRVRPAGAHPGGADRSTTSTSPPLRSAPSSWSTTATTGAAT